MLDKVLKTIRDFSMLQAGEGVCVALSGGADSVCLALALKELGYKVHCVHINHNLRGEESDRDEQFCRDFCKANNLALAVESVDVKAFCEENKFSLEEGARALRYEALLKNSKGNKLATAHNLNDCLETTIFNLTRGAGLKGLLGIPPVRDNIIRPLIRISREEIEAYLKAHNQSFVSDSTNFMDDCSRNVIRLNVLPELLRINSGLLKTYESELALWQESYDYINREVSAAFEACRADDSYDLGNLADNAVLSGVVGMILKENDIELASERINAVKALVLNGGKLNIKKGVYILSESGKLSISRDSDNEKLFVSIEKECDEAFGDKRVVITKVSPFDVSCHNNKSLKYILDADKLKSNLVLRSYSGNEKIKLCGKEHSQVVKKLISKTPQSMRNSVVVISDDEGAVFVEEFGVAERVKCDENTKTALQVNVCKKV